MRVTFGICQLSQRLSLQSRVNMRILLVRPYYVTPEDNARSYPVEPLGLLYIATYLLQEARKNGVSVEVKVLDTQMQGPESTTKTHLGHRSGMTDEQLVECFRTYNADVIGISNNYTVGTDSVLELARLARQTCPSARIVLGGAHATLDSDHLIRVPEVDIVVRGEGEITFKELVFALVGKTGLAGIPGISYRDQNGIHVNEPRPFLEDLDALPIPDRGLVDYPAYLGKEAYLYTKSKPVGTVFTSRGCPFRCVFCSTQKTWGNHWRGRSPGNIIKEVECLRDTYGVREIAFQDDQLLGDPQRMIDFCKLVVERKLGMSFIAPPGNSPARMSTELLDWMAKAGFYRLCFSVDVGTEKAAKYVKKPVMLRKIRGLVKHANSKGIWTYGTFVIGFPNENQQDVRETIRYAHSLRLDFVRFYIAQPYLGSELYARYEAQGKISREIAVKSHSIMDAFMGTDYLTGDDLVSLRNRGECGYAKARWKHLLNPWYLATELLPKIASRDKFRYFAGLILRAAAMHVRYIRPGA